MNTLGDFVHSITGIIEFFFLTIYIIIRSLAMGVVFFAFYATAAMLMLVIFVGIFSLLSNILSLFF